ncbi:MAG: glycosyltransferase family 4 protein [Alphaproteobacteria bacterium]
MRIAFYAPLKAPVHAVPSGDRRMAGLIVAALEAAGHEVALASDLRAYEGAGDAARQAAIRAAGDAEAETLARRYRSAPVAERPHAWFTYHVYHKAPDWLGPAVSEALAIPYVIAEASLAPKQANGPWAEGHAAAAAAIARADAVLAMTRDDTACLEPLVRAPERLLSLTPFLDPAPYRAARAERAAHRARLAADLGLDEAVPWLLAVAMMRRDEKRESYLRLAAALARTGDVDWCLVVVGDGPARDEIEMALAAAHGRAAYAGAQPPDILPRFYAATDVYAWPAVNEAYGMALLEAQAAGLPVVAGRVRGVPEVVRDGETGLLAPPDDDDAFAAALRRVLADTELRARLGERAAANVVERHGMATAAKTLEHALALAGAGA